MTTVKTRKNLARIAENLKTALGDVDRGFVYLSQSDAELLATAFEAFLSGKARSLDDAFNVKRGRGAPKRGPTDTRIMELVEKAIWRGRKSWKEIADELNIEDTRYLQKLVQRHADYAIEKMAREIAERFNAKDGAKVD